MKHLLLLLLLLGCTDEPVIINQSTNGSPAVACVDGDVTINGEKVEAKPGECPKNIKSITQTTTGKNSAAIFGVKGNVTITTK